MRRYTAEEKSRWLKQWKASGMTANEFAIDKPFHVNTLKYWDTKSAYGRDVPASFIEVIPSQPSTLPMLRLIFPCGVTMELDHLPDLTILKALIRC